MSQLLRAESVRGMPRWRAGQRSLSVSEKVSLLGRVVLETREWEKTKRLCKPSVTSSKNCWPKES